MLYSALVKDFFVAPFRIQDEPVLPLPFSPLKTLEIWMKLIEIQICSQSLEGEAEEYRLTLCFL